MTSASCCGRSYRPRPDNGSGDSPRPPFLTEFVNQIGKCDLVDLVYHLFGGQLGLRIHSHVERSFRLKTKASRRVVQLQAADSQVGQNSVDGRCVVGRSQNLRTTCEAASPSANPAVDLGQRPTTNDQQPASPARFPAPPDPYRPQSNDPVRRGVLRFRNCARPGPPWRRYTSRHA